MAIDNLTDTQIVEAILNRNSRITKEYLYQKCWPLFYNIFSRYYTDCSSAEELISEIYLYIIMPGRDGQCKLEKFGYRCTLTMWLKIVTENYCKQQFSKKLDITENILVDSDRNDFQEQSLELKVKQLDMDDAEKILRMMPNERYRNLIRYVYLEEKTHDEAAMLLGMNMDNYYNKHRLAKAQLCTALRKEGLI